MESKRRRGRMVRRVLFVIGLLLSGAAGCVAATLSHRMDSSLGMLNYDKDNALEKVDISKYDTVSDNEVVNILLVGADKDENEQNVKGVSRRSDSMMIATLDMKHKKLKVTSLMRDMYLEIPGHGKNKFNSAYQNGGIKLLYETIASNFGIKLDGYAEVNFDAFVEVINKVGGIQVDVTESEAKHLNTTNYIKRKKNRNLKPGKQVLNGYQALGYSRIRHGKRVNGVTPPVYSASGKADDYGRTERQRNVIQALLTKVKSMSVDQWLDLIDVVMPNVKTDLSKDDIYSYMVAIAKLGTTKLDQYRVPADNTFTSPTINGSSVLDIDLEKNKNGLHNFIFKK
ncbi:LCP family protein, partial [Eubacterium xylanophilum]|uniref:LCP family protein n=1 Tax=Eubacterium xylanophilum TaxID=39497 RepID=UPI0004BB420A